MTSQELRNEWAVLGAILIDPEYALPIAVKILTPDDFGDGLNRTAFEVWMEAQDAPIDWLILQNKLVDAGYGSMTVDVVVRDWLNTPTATNVGEYAKLVKEQSNIRKLRAVAKEIEDTGILNEELRAKIEAIDSAPVSEVQTSEQMCQMMLTRYNEISENPDAAFCKSGYPSLDRVLGGGFQKSGLYIIGARPGMGKTTLALNIADKIARRGDAVLFVSLEMSAMQITAKRLAINCYMQYSSILTAGLSESMVRQKFLPGLDELSKRPFFCSDSSALTVAEIARKARCVDNLKMIVVDYLGLIRATDESKKLYEQVTEISRDLKALAKRMNIPVIALCQVNRQSVQNRDKRPSLADLRDSGSIEQDADGVIMLYRQDYFQKEEDDGPTQSDTIELIIAKNRHGEGNATIPMTWIGETGMVAEIDYKH